MFNWIKDIFRNYKLEYMEKVNRDLKKTNRELENENLSLAENLGNLSAKCLEFEVKIEELQNQLKECRKSKTKKARYLKPDEVKEIENELNELGLIVENKDIKELADKWGVSVRTIERIWKREHKYSTKGNNE